LRERQRERESVTISDEREKESSFLCGWILNTTTYYHYYSG